MVRAADEEVVSRTLHDAGGHAILHHEGVDHYRPIWVSEPGIDFIDAADVQYTDAISIRLQQVAGVGIPGLASQSGWRYSASTGGSGRGLATECPQSLVDERTVVAGNCISGTARSSRIPYQ